MVPFDMGNDTTSATAAAVRRRLVNMANADLNMTQLKGCIYHVGMSCCILTRRKKKQTPRVDGHVSQI